MSRFWMIGMPYCGSRQSQNKTHNIYINNIIMSGGMNYHQTYFNESTVS